MVFKILKQVAKTIQSPPLTVVKAIIVREDGKVLVLRRSKVISLRHMNDLPGGVVDKGENLEMALVREVLEETGLAVAGHTKIDVTNFMTWVGPVQMHTYVCNASGKIKLSWEHDAYWWAAPVEIDSCSLLPSRYRRVVDKHAAMLPHA